MVNDRLQETGKALKEEAKESTEEALKEEVHASIKYETRFRSTICALHTNITPHKEFVFKKLNKLVCIKLNASLWLFYTIKE